MKRRSPRFSLNKELNYLPVLTPVIHKGGPGKTTMVRLEASFIANFISPLAKKNKRPYKVLVVDLDPQMNSTKYLIKDKVQTAPCPVTGEIIKVPPEHPDMVNDPDNGGITRSTVCDLYTTGYTPLPYESWLENVEVVAAGEAELEELERTPAVQVKEKIKVFADWLKSEDLKEEYLCVIIDTPPRKNILTRMALAAASHVFIPFCTDASHIDGVESAIHLITNEIQNRPTDHPLKFIGMLPNQVEERTVNAQEMLSQLKDSETYGRYVTSYFLSHSAHFLEMVNPDNGGLFDSSAPFRPKIKTQMTDIGRSFSREMDLIV